MQSLDQYAGPTCDCPGILVEVAMENDEGIVVVLDECERCSTPTEQEQSVIVSLET